MFKLNALSAFAINGDAITRQALTEMAASAQRFVADLPGNYCGWAPVRQSPSDPLIEHVTDRWTVLRFARQIRRAPAAAVARELDRQCAKLKDETGHEPSGKSRRELRAEIAHTMSLKAIAKVSMCPVIVDHEARMVLIGSATSSMLDPALSLIVGSVPRSNLHPVSTRDAHASLLANIILSAVDDESGDEGITLGDRPEFTLRAGSGGDMRKVTVSGMIPSSGAASSADSVRALMTQGLLPTKVMAATEHATASVDANLRLRGIKTLTKPESGDDAWAASALIVLTEVSEFIGELVHMGGGPSTLPIEEAAA